LTMATFCAKTAPDANASAMAVLLRKVFFIMIPRLKK
jgi:hypothetical protein